MGKLGRRDAERLAQIEALYAQLPTVACRGGCAVACGPIPLTTLEASRLQMVTHVAPRTTPAHVCTYLDARQRCTAYQARPLICRVYGVLRGLSCPRGCVPDRWLTDQEFLRIAQAIERLGGPLVVTHPDGVALKDDSFLRIAQLRDDAAIERNAVRLHALRALHGGRIIAAVENGPGGWIDFDKDQS